MNHARHLACMTALALLSGCSTTGSYAGQLEAQLGTTLPDDLRVVAKAEPAATDLTCQSFEATVDAAGAFQIDGLCAETTYALSLSDKNLLIEGSNQIQGSEDGAPPTLMKIWPSPAGNGVVMLTDGALKAVSTYTDVKTLQLLGSEQPVHYPRHKPNGSVLVEEGSHLVVAGTSNISRLAFSPLVEETLTRSFHDGYTLGPHFYVGLQFQSDTEVEVVSAELDASKVTNVMGADMAIRYIAHDALAPGHYALMGPDDTRMYIITFGPVSQDTVSENTAGN